VNDSHVHDLTKLLNVSGLSQLQQEEARNVSFATKWGTVKDWSEASRYDTSITQARASAFFVAVTDPENGVLAWLKKHW
jgi:hypothetical protein